MATSSAFVMLGTNVNQICCWSNVKIGSDTTATTRTRSNFVSPCHISSTVFRHSFITLHRLPHNAEFQGSELHKKSNNILKSVKSLCNEGMARHISSSLDACRCRLSIRRFTPRPFLDKSAFYLSKHSNDNVLLAKQFHVTSIPVAPNEAHTGTTCTDDILKKPAFNILNPEFEITKSDGFLSSELPSHPKLYRGQLKNGLRYVILPNKVPPNRFEAHMEVHVGSIDEEDDEQGIAHMVEHVVFLGSKKREKLHGTGAQSNAYTDFHHTVFHFHSPTKNKIYDGDLLPFTLDALNEIVFNPQFLVSRVEKERRAILSEHQMNNTINYRIECQLLQHLHSENKISKRLPIGLEDQIKKWDADKIRKFHERWYFPSNATLYIVGDIDNVLKTVYQIEAIFGKNGIGNNMVAKPASTLMHNWSLPGKIEDAKPAQIFEHELLPDVEINIFRKVPIRKIQTYGDLRNVVMKKILLYALHIRIKTRYKSSNPLFTAIDLDHNDSVKEGCAVTTLSVNSGVENWQRAIKIAVREVRRLKEFGVTKGELACYLDALLKDSEKLAFMIDTVPSVHNLNFIMERDALGHTVMDQRQRHESWVAVAKTITLEEVNSVGAKMLEFISDYGKPTAPVPAAIVACVPKTNPEFKISPSDVISAITSGLQDVTEAEPELEVPRDLISPFQLQELRFQRKPSFVPLDPAVNTTKLYYNEIGITQCQLSNGISINYKISSSEPGGGVMRLIVAGGRSAETSESIGAVPVGIQTLTEGAHVGKFSGEQLELFCINNSISYSMESTEEFICMEIRFRVRNDGMRAAFQLLHMTLQHSIWTDDAFDRAIEAYMSYYRSTSNSLERLTAHKLMLAMLNGDQRFLVPTPIALQNLTLQSVKHAVMSQFAGDNMEVNVIGNFLEEEIESCILDYLGTVRAKRVPYKNHEFIPITFRPSPSDVQFQQVFLKDTDERACAYIAGPALNQWGYNVEGKDVFKSVMDMSTVHDEQESEQSLSERKVMVNERKLRHHPLFFGITMELLTNITNSRLFTSVRESLGLTYSVSFELSLFERLNLGWYVISVTSTPAKVHQAVDACKIVLRNLYRNKISQLELDRAKRTLLMRHEANFKSNTYWLGLLNHLQASSIPKKDISCVRDRTWLYEAVTIEDIYLAYDQLKLDEDSIYSCIGISGPKAGEENPVVVESGKGIQE